MVTGISRCCEGQWLLREVRREEVAKSRIGEYLFETLVNKYTFQQKPSLRHNWHF
jgi:hypothetical protein